MTCDKCGHPNVFRSKTMPYPDPRRGMTANCVVCEKSIVYDSHHWETVALDGKKYVCCSCYSVTAPLTNHALAVRQSSQRRK